MMKQAPVFDDLDGEFSGRLREIVSTTRQTADGSSTVTFSTAVIECDYNPNVVKKLATGQLIAIPNVQTLGAEDVFSVYEIADVFPMHYSQPNLDRSQPAAIRKEFMELIEGEWKKGSKSTWIEIVAAPIGYVMRTSPDGSIAFERKPYAPLAGSSVRLLSRDSVEKLICYRVPKGEQPADYRFGNLLGVIDEKIPFTVDIEKLLHFHVGVFAFTGSGKSNLTSTVIRKALKVIPDLKVVILDVSSEYGLHILDVLNEYPSKVLFTDSFAGSKQKAAEYFKRHVCPEALADLQPEFEKKISKLFDDDKVVFAELPLEGSEEVERFSTYGGLIEVLTNTLNDKYGAVQQKIYVPQVISRIKEFMHDEGFTPDTRFNAKTMKLITQIQTLITDLPATSSLKKTFDGLGKVVEQATARGGAGKVPLGDPPRRDSLHGEGLPPGLRHQPPRGRGRQGPDRRRHQQGLPQEEEELQPDPEGPLHHRRGPGVHPPGREEGRQRLRVEQGRREAPEAREEVQPLLLGEHPEDSAPEHERPPAAPQLLHLDDAQALRQAARRGHLRDRGRLRRQDARLPERGLAHHQLQGDGDPEHPGLLPRREQRGDAAQVPDAVVRVSGLADQGLY